MTDAVARTRVGPVRPSQMQSSLNWPAKRARADDSPRGSHPKDEAPATVDKTGREAEADGVFGSQEEPSCTQEEPALSSSQEAELAEPVEPPGREWLLAPPGGGGGKALPLASLLGRRCCGRAARCGLAGCPLAWREAEWPKLWSQMREGGTDDLPLPPLTPWPLESCVAKHVSRTQCVLLLEPDGVLTLVALKPVSVRSVDTEGEEAWENLELGQSRTLRGHTEVALQRAPRLIYQLFPSRPLGSCVSFDEQYRRVLRSVIAKGVVQSNTKGANRALDHVVHLDLDLAAAGLPDRALPITTLRWIKPRHALVEALWYLRGESDIAYLQRHGNPFWNKQAKDGEVGLAYGLLVRWGSRGASNQLESRVIDKLVQGESSRRMVVSLCKPDEPTVQEACTLGCQFVVREAGRLDLLLHQRSSDLMLGLPFDVVVWSVLLHLVCREVGLRTDGARTLRAGRLHVQIGSAHIYEENLEDALQISAREPKPGLAPSLHIADGARGLFEIARDESDSRAPGGGFDACRGPGGLSVQGYERDRVHPPIALKQAVGAAQRNVL